MSNWFCLRCDFVTDIFKEVWSHCKGASHVMQLTNTGEVNRKYRPKFQWPLKDKDYGDESLK